MVVRKSTVSIVNPDETINQDAFDEDENMYSHLIIVHVFDHCVQDSEIVVGILSDVLLHVKQADVNVKNAFIRSDNAGCYHSAQSIFSLTKISQEINIHIRRIDFCDPQGGKGPCDRYAGIIKSYVRRFLNEKHNVTTAAEFVEVINSNEGVRGVYAYEARLGKMATRPPTQFTKIKLVNNFSLESSGIRVHRSWKVGDGKFISLSKLELPDSISTILCNNTLNSKTALFAIAQAKNKPRDLPKRFTGTSKNIYINRLFDCYEEG